MLLKRLLRNIVAWIIGTVGLKRQCVVILAIAAKVKPGKQKEFLQAMRSLNDDLKEEEGLRRSTLRQEKENGFCLIHEWETQQDMDRYFGTEKFRVLDGALTVLTEESEISYREISQK